MRPARGRTGYLAEAEVWDPATGAWGPAGSLAHARQDHTETSVADGRVLITGGLGRRDRTIAAAEAWQ